MAKEAIESLIVHARAVCAAHREELWEQFGHDDTLLAATWPAFDAEAAEGRSDRDPGAGEWQAARTAHGRAGPRRSGAGTPCAGRAQCVPVRAGQDHSQSGHRARVGSLSIVV